jgi:DNA-binding response OmpR family regulator
MKKVLVVEDDKDINKALCCRLRSAGYDVITAEDSITGLCNAVKVRPDVLILDITMPGGDGFSIVERLREHTSLGHLPFIILTASRRPEYRQTARRLGAHAYLEKPYEAVQLLEAVEDAIATGYALPALLADVVG